MRLLVTGGAGYIGSVVAALRSRAGHEVTVLDDLSTGHARRRARRGATFVRGHASGPTRRRSWPTAPTRCCTSRPSRWSAESVANPALYWQHNLGGTLALLEAMRVTGTRRIVFSSTAAVYGEPERVPIAETAPTRPTSPYGASKLAVDTALAEHARLHGIGAVSLRYFNVAGAHPGPDGGWLGERHDPETHLIPNILARRARRRRPGRVVCLRRRLPDAGRDLRPRLHPRDRPGPGPPARAGRLRARPAPGLQPGQRHRVLQPAGARACREVTGQEIPVQVSAPRAGDPAVLVASSERIQAELRLARRARAWHAMVADAWQFALEQSLRLTARPGGGETADRLGPAAGSGLARPEHRGGSRAGPGQPDRRAHRLQPGLGAAVRAGPGVMVAAGRRGDGMLAIRSLPGTGRPGRPAARRAGPGAVTGWAAYPAGVAWALREAGHPRRAGPAWPSTPTCRRAPGCRPRPRWSAPPRWRWTGCTGWTCPGRNWPRWPGARKTISWACPAGSWTSPRPCSAEAGHALLLDCRTRRRPAGAVRPGRRGAGAAGRRHRRPARAGRRQVRAAPAECERAARALGVPRAARRDRRRARPAGSPTRCCARRARHVITENRRVHRRSALLAAGDLAGLAALLHASHASLRDDFEISWPQADVAVRGGRRAGALGARMIGGGFGGSVIALVPAGARGRSAPRSRRSYARRGWPPPAFLAAPYPPRARTA